MRRIKSLKNTGKGSLAAFIISVVFLLLLGNAVYLNPFIAGIAGSLLILASLTLYSREWFPEIKIPAGSSVAAISGLLFVAAGVKMTEMILPLFNSGELSLTAVFSYFVMLYASGFAIFGAVHSLGNYSVRELEKSSEKIFYSILTALGLALIPLVTSGVSNRAFTPLISQVSSSAVQIIAESSVITTAVLLPVTYHLGRITWEKSALGDYLSLKNSETYSKIVNIEKKFSLLVTIGLPGLILLIQMSKISGIFSSISNIFYPLISLPRLKIGLVYLSLFSVASIFVFRIFSLFRNGREKLVPQVIFAGLIMSISVLFSEFLYSHIITQSTALASLEGLRQIFPNSIVGSIVLTSGLLSIGLIFPFIYTLSVSFLSITNLIPPDHTGEAVSASGTFITGLASVFAGLHPIFFFTSLALSLIVWSAGKESSELRKEVGLSGTTWKVELTKLTASVIVGTGSIALAVYLSYRIPENLLPAISAEAIIPGFLGLILAISALAEFRSPEN